ncbi:hypothetical protein ET445_00575 [Agromyces protaetiae]|uniref:Cardiolipin synthase N-terminal domain-containing protein n=1 Tax=Agromyces protaetiae TaxID=2509455 RepID=A0A4P6F926_9MICO|nr:PLDc N-terminal domain-containing protein [Agromyces protaetiae]QAY72046.1 hypothetical protein ET445_00575 [Agromyces protaetiae]
MAVLFSVITLVAVVAALVDIITRDDWQVKHLPKIAWVLLVVFLPLVGVILWFALGREWNLPERAPRPARTQRGYGASVHAGNLPVVPRDTRTTEEQLADLDREIEYYKKRAELEALKKDADGEGASA